MKTDYSDEIKALIKRNYEVVNSDTQASAFTVRKTLKDIFAEVTSVLPSDWIHESDVYEALIELGFKNFMYDTEADTDGDGKIIFPSQTHLAFFLERK